MKKLLTIFAAALMPVATFASEADLKIPDGIQDEPLLYWGFLITFLGFLFGLFQFVKVKKLRTQLSSLPIKFNA